MKKQKKNIKKLKLLEKELEIKNPIISREDSIPVKTNNS